MGHWLNSLKDTALAAGVRKFLGSRLEGYGRITQLKIDTQIRQIELGLLLEGESAPVEVVLRNYAIADQAGVVSISAPTGAFTTSRAWLTTLLNAQVAGRQFVIPEPYAKYAWSLVG